MTIVDLAVTIIKLWEIEKCKQFSQSAGFQLSKPFVTKWHPKRFCFQAKITFLDLLDMYFCNLQVFCQYLGRQ
jgi:hypothetical protein